MSTFTRTTTPSYSANPLQTFVTYKQARRAARGASPIAFLFAGLIVVSLLLTLASAEFENLSEAKKVAFLVTAGIMIAGFLCLGWRIWARPGPWKIAPLLAVHLLDFVIEMFRFSVLNLVIVGVLLNFCVIAFRGALAMKRLYVQSDLDVF